MDADGNRKEDEELWRRDEEEGGISCGRSLGRDKNHDHDGVWRHPECSQHAAFRSSVIPRAKLLLNERQHPSLHSWMSFARHAAQKTLVLYDQSSSSMP